MARLTREVGPVGPAGPRMYRPTIRRRAMHYERLALVLITLLACAGILLVRGVYDVWKPHLSLPGVTATTTATGKVAFTIRPGESASQIADDLARKGLIDNSLLFRLYAKFRHQDNSLEAGTYNLQAGMSMADILNHLQRSYQKDVYVTIIPGMRVEQVADMLSAHGVVDKTAFLKAVKDTPPNQTLEKKFAFLNDRPKGASLEGYLYPDSYLVPKKLNAPQDVLSTFLTGFGNVITPGLVSQIHANHETVFQVVVLASIVEREAVLASERPLIAGVYSNRQYDDMLWNADPTVQYAVASQPGAGDTYWPQLSTADLQIDSPYNTYIHHGPPPGPICEPAQGSLLAAITPAKTDYLYFVAKGDGSHIFAKTLDEQNANVAKYGQH